MRKFYSLVLIAAALLIGTNAWASVHSIQDDDDEAKVQINGGEWQYATYLKEAFDAVQPGQTAEIVLLNPVTLNDHITMPATINSTVLAGTCQNITLDLNGKNITVGDNVTAFRIVKGTLNVQGTGNIIKASATGNVWLGGAIITIAGAEDPSTKNWSNLTIGQNVVLSITPGVKNGTGIIIQDMNTLKGITNTSDPLYTSASEEPATLKDKFGYCTYYFPSTEVLAEKDVMEPNKCGPGSPNAEILPMHCGAPYENSKKIQQGSAYGVNVTIEGTIIAGKRALQIIGHVNQKPECVENHSATKRKYPNPSQVGKDFYYDSYYPYIKVTSTAKLSASSIGGCTGIYGAGYGVFDIAGEVVGATGIYMKAGDVNLQDAYVHSNSTTNTPSNGGASGVNNAGGSAIAIESNDAYAGGSGLSITGDTKVEGNGGYAIFEETYKADNTATTSHVSIEGGTIQGGDAGAIAITVDSKNDNVVTVSGGNVSTTGTTPAIIVNEDTTIPVSELFPNTSYHTTEVEVDGKTVIVVSQGEAPATDSSQETTPWSWCAADAQSGKSVAWTKIEADEIEANATVVLNELQIISGTESNLQELTINSGATLQVNHLIMNDYARIIVKAGGKLIVKGTQGIVAPKVSNILIKTSETDQGIFLFNPKVSSNKYPNATVEFKSKAYLNGSKGVFQRFGVPTWNREDKKTSMKTASGTAKTWITQYDYAIDDWAAWTPYENATDIVIANALPFRGYMLYSNNDKDHKKDYTFEGNLIGNQNENLHMYYGWNYFANSYTAPISIKDFINTVMASLDADKQDYVLGTIYLYKNTGDDDYTWSGVNLNTQIKEFVIVDNAVVEVQNQLDIQPMQAFLMRLNLIDGEMDQPISYEYDVYNPNMGIANNNQYLAPARATQANNEMHVLVSGEGSWDKVYVVENNNFSNDFENGYDAYKYDGKTGVNLYAMNSDARMEILATDDAEGTFLGIDAPKAGNYTLHVAGVEGMEYAIVDMETNAVINAVNGTKYQFYANAGANDYRFQVVKVAKIPTAIENTEAVKSAKGVYTLTGQFLGNDVNALPAGVYIVNGVKVVK